MTPQNFLYIYPPYEIHHPAEQTNFNSSQNIINPVELEDRFDIVVYPDSGELIVTPAKDPFAIRVRKLRALNEPNRPSFRGFLEAATPNYFYPFKEGSTAPGRAYNTVRRKAVAESLEVHAILKYEDHASVKFASRHIERYTSQLRKSVAPLPYVAASERGEITNQFHWHMLTQITVPEELIRAKWGHGEVEVRHATDWDHFERQIGYLTGPFFDESNTRDFKNRYKVNRGKPTLKIKHSDVCQGEIDVLVQQLAGDNYSTVETSFNLNKWVIARHRWKPQHLHHLN